MSLKIHPVERKVLAGPDKDIIKTYGSVLLTGTVDFDRLCEKIAKLSTATKGDVRIVLNTLIFVLIEILSSGNIAQLGDLGNFRVSAGSKGVDNPEDFHASMMCRPKVLFYPGKQLRRLRNEVKFEQMIVKTVEVPCDQPHQP